ncbi:MAG: hypothetical protein COV52_04000 [Gammaproteobacteria bacterium CG11_big_fil_rev_8_21_14_0_20_46_22]|nr:MAG: hypothetical protein COW05_04195 [Gammaproteobacteria bacterium CG12_big_fil_rev_8_21_14_0_65_46_12]PIR11360.1 MAG: hypothetical protein COV52_04000 [Gammaproteobacteria bacterium CG11_big_fil_rev_8_21_14_0_20_46_22]
MPGRVFFAIADPKHPLDAGRLRQILKAAGLDPKNTRLVGSSVGLSNGEDFVRPVNVNPGSLIFVLGQTQYPVLHLPATFPDSWRNERDALQILEAQLKGFEGVVMGLLDEGRDVVFFVRQHYSNGIPIPDLMLLNPQALNPQAQAARFVPAVFGGKANPPSEGFPWLVLDMFERMCDRGIALNKRHSQAQLSRETEQAWQAEQYRQAEQARQEQQAWQEQLARREQLARQQEQARQEQARQEQQARQQQAALRHTGFPYPQSAASALPPSALTTPGWQPPAPAPQQPARALPPAPTTPPPPQSAASASSPSAPATHDWRPPAPVPLRSAARAAAAPAPVPVPSAPPPASTAMPSAPPPASAAMPSAAAALPIGPGRDHRRVQLAPAASTAATSNAPPPASAAAIPSAPLPARAAATSSAAVDGQVIYVQLPTDRHLKIKDLINLIRTLFPGLDPAAIGLVLAANNWQATDRIDSPVVGSGLAVLARSWLQRRGSCIRLPTVWYQRVYDHLLEVWQLLQHVPEDLPNDPAVRLGIQQLFRLLGTGGPAIVFVRRWNPSGPFPVPLVGVKFVHVVDPDGQVRCIPAPPVEPAMWGGAAPFEPELFQELANHYHRILSFISGLKHPSSLDELTAFAETIEDQANRDAFLTGLYQQQQSGPRFGVSQNPVNLGISALEEHLRTQAPAQNDKRAALRQQAKLKQQAALLRKHAGLLLSGIGNLRAQAHGLRAHIESLKASYQALSAQQSEQRTQIKALIDEAQGQLRHFEKNRSALTQAYRDWCSPYEPKAEKLRAQQPWSIRLARIVEQILWTTRQYVWRQSDAAFTEEINALKAERWRSVMAPEVITAISDLCTALPPLSDKDKLAVLTELLTLLTELEDRKATIPHEILSLLGVIQGHQENLVQDGQIQSEELISRTNKSLRSSLTDPVSVHMTEAAKAIRAHQNITIAQILCHLLSRYISSLSPSSTSHLLAAMPPPSAAMLLPPAPMPPADWAPMQTLPETAPLPPPSAAMLLPPAPAPAAEEAIDTTPSAPPPSLRQ